MTFGLDQAWRRGTVAALALPDGALVLDLACGTGDLSRARAAARLPGRRRRPQCGHARRPTAPSTPLVEADGSRLPFVDGAFDGLVCGYALRNFTDLAATLAESARVLRPGGRLAVLEVDAPTGAAVARRLRRVVHQGRARPRGALSDKEAYRYLPQSVAYLPPAPVLRPCCAAAGFSAVGIRPLAGGLSQLVVATRAGDAVTRGAARPHRAARVRARRAGVRRQPHRPLRPPRADPGRLGHGASSWAADRGGSGPRRHPVRRRRRRPGLGTRGPGRPPVRRRHRRAPRDPALHHGDVARRRRRDPALGHRGRAGRRRAARHRRALRRRHLAVRHDAHGRGVQRARAWSRWRPP